MNDPMGITDLREKLNAIEDSFRMPRTTTTNLRELRAIEDQIRSEYHAMQVHRQRRDRMLNRSGICGWEAEYADQNRTNLLHLFKARRKELGR